MKAFEALICIIRLKFYEWAQREIDPMNPDVYRVTHRARDLRQQWSQLWAK